MNTFVTLRRRQRPIFQGSYKGMDEIITNMDCNMPFLCYFCGQKPGIDAYWSIIGDRDGNAYCARCLCASCAREQINGIPDRAGQSPFESLDPHKERRRVQDLKKRSCKTQKKSCRKELMVCLLAKLIIGLACLAGALFVIGFAYMIINFFTER